MEVVSAIITPVVESLLVPVTRHLGFLFSSTKYVSDMLDRKRKLECAANDMKRRKELNDVNTLMVPDRVPSWLEEAQVIINKEGDSISAGGNGCLHMKERYKAGKHCFNVIKSIKSLMEENSNMKWTNEPIPLARVDSATPQVLQDVTQNIFGSRKEIFQRALQLLEADDTTQMVALCGMGGIGKTTMMEELKKVVENRKLFDQVVRVVIGKSTDPIAFQDAIAQYTCKKLSESTREARADRLQKRFLGMSQDGKKKILIILDDLWNIVDLKDIGLASPLPGLKFFLTSRDEWPCRQMGVETSSILRMVGLDEAEAKQLFWETISDRAVDHQLKRLGEDIVKRCGGLPMAIKTIASALKDEIKEEWIRTLERLRQHDLSDPRNLQKSYDFVHHIFVISYDYLKNDDDQKIFVLSGLFPDDFDISLEDLVRYGWGLELFDNVRSLSDARQRTNISVHKLKRANLLLESDRKGCVKMHDLARSFVLSNISKFKQASIVNHSDMLERRTQDTRESCERIFLKCKGMSEFPEHFVYPNLKLLKLMMNDYEFPDGFYTRMKQLQVISYLSISNPSLVPISLQCSTSLRVLCLRSCSLMDDLSSIGQLSNLEILSFADCFIKNLPSTVGNLKNLKLLELTGCDELCIGDGVFQNLDNLEELYMRNLYGQEVISFTEDNCEGLEMVSKKLTALEVEFFENNIRPKNVSFKNLERFRISIGCQLDRISQYDDDVYSFENTLRLVASCEEVHAFEINELFEKTEQLHLEVEDMNLLEDVLMHPSDQYFCNLKHLSIEYCANLKYLFTVNVASTLSNLEILRVEYCPVLGSLIHDENNGAEVIIFRKLKRLELRDLPMFVGLCDNINIIMKLPQLVKLRLHDLPNITEDREKWGINNRSVEVIQDEEFFVPWSLGQYSREITIKRCHALSTVIPSYAAEQLQKIEVLKIDDCNSMVEVFKTKELENSPLTAIPRLKSITTHKLHNLKRLYIVKCHRLVDIFTFSTLESLRLLKKLSIRDCKQLKVIVREEHGEQTTTTSSKAAIFPCLQSITLEYLPNVKGFFFGMNEFQLPLLDEVIINRCPQMKVFTPLPLRAPKLKYIDINGGKYRTPVCCSFFTMANRAGIFDTDTIARHETT